MPIAKYKILAIEDERQMQKLIDTSLQENGYQVKICSNQQDALSQIQMFHPDLVLLDLGLPDGDGKEFIAKVKEYFFAPIIVVSARNSENEIVESLNIGADDYIIKPFYINELLARINSTLRRSQKKEGLPTIKIENLELDIEKREITLNNSALHLTPLEFNLLKYFMQNSGKALTHNQILKEVWGTGYQNDTKTLRTFVNQVRKKIESNPNMPTKLVTISGVGYRFG